MESLILKSYCDKWHLLRPELFASTHTSSIYKVYNDDKLAILKILNESQAYSERSGPIVLRFFKGYGSVRLLESDETAQLIEFVDGIQVRMLVDQGKDIQAIGVICGVLDKLHGCKGSVPPEIHSMESNFQSLLLKAQHRHADSIYSLGAQMAEILLSQPQEARVLHGDIHHENILFSSNRGWLAIDPKGLFGERTYDAANIFYNPKQNLKMVETEQVIHQRSLQSSKLLKLDQKRILQYAFAYGCLSAAWSAEDGQAEEPTLRIARRIQRILYTSFA